MMKWLLIGAGGAAGSMLRYAVQGFVQRITGGGFPSGTLVVNVIGSLLIGFMAAALTGPILIREEYRVGLTVGVLGGFTTFSALELETFNLTNDGQFRLASAYVVLSLLLGYVAVWIGFRVAERWFGV